MFVTFDDFVADACACAVFVTCFVADVGDAVVGVVVVAWPSVVVVDVCLGVGVVFGRAPVNTCPSAAGDVGSPIARGVICCRGVCLNPCVESLV